VTTIITDAELVSKFAQQAMQEPVAEVVTKSPSNPIVKLPAGYINPAGELITTAEVKELTGSDEEAIAKIGSTAKAINLLLQRGLLKLGDKEATRDDLDLLLAGDRDTILLGIRKVTFGTDIKLSIRCVGCGSPDDNVVVNLDEDVKVKFLADPIADRTWEVNTSKGTIRLGLPNGVTQKKIMDNLDKTPAEINTILLAGCILSVDGAPAMGAPTALSLGMADRATIINDILDRNPGPRLGEVKKVCKACGEDVIIPLSLLDLFRV